jgi:lysophospholipase L1-like esterase
MGVMAVVLGICRADILLEDSFERPDIGRWQQTWGPVARTRDRAHNGDWSVRETLEDKHGLSVWYVEFDAYPGAVYTASAWVYVPAQTQQFEPALTVNRMNWSRLGEAHTDVRNEWVRLSVTYRNTSESRIRLQLFQRGQKSGLGGGILYWDDVVVERKLEPLDMDAGIGINPHVVEGLEVTTKGMTVTVAPGVIDVNGTQITVAESTTLAVAPARIMRVRNEQSVLSDEEPRGYGHGTPLRECLGRGTTLAGMLVPDSLVVKAGAEADAQIYVEGRDWRADKAWGRVGRVPDGRIQPEQTVFLDYDCGLMRIDTVEVRTDGKVVVRRGAEHRSVPQPPEVDEHSRALCNVFLPYHCRELAPSLIYPVGPPLPSPSQVELERKAALVPKTHAKLAAGEEVTVVFWGDSVTCGGDASSQENAFPLSFTNWLRCRYPAAHIRYVNAGTGGWNSRSKLPLFDEQVLAHNPDLMVIEFVNDMGFGRDLIFANYADAVSRVRAQGGEVIILTPHFVRPDWMGAGSNMRTPEIRKAVGYLKEFAAENNAGLADASRRWEHLWVEGIPYMTMLFNGINHPDDRGHQLFVDELKLFFQAEPPRDPKAHVFDMPPQ